MNENDLRDHLRVALDPVGGTPPSVRDLRAAAHRRTRSSRLAVGAVSLVVLAGAGVGIAAAAGGPARTSVRPAGEGAMHLACRPSSDVHLSVGQRLTVDCPVGGDSQDDSTVSPPGVLTKVDVLSFQATSAGTATITVTGSLCISTRDLSCPAVSHAFAITVVVVPTTGMAGTVSAPCGNGSVTVARGDQIVLADCPAEEVLANVADEAVVAANPVAAIYPPPVPSFTAQSVGTTTITLTARPLCPANASCAYAPPTALGTLTVSVTSGPRTPDSSSTPPVTTSPAYDANDPSTWKVSVEGYGPLRIGMTAQQVKAIVGSTYAAQSVTSTCSQVTSSRLPQVVPQVEGGVYTATYVGTTADPTGGPSTVGGIHLGQAETDAAKALGPSATASRYVSDPSTTEYDLTTSDGKATVLAKGGKVIGYSEGRTAGGEFACL